MIWVVPPPPHPNHFSVQRVRAAKPSSFAHNGWKSCIHLERIHCVFSFLEQEDYLQGGLWDGFQVKDGLRGKKAQRLICIIWLSTHTHIQKKKTSPCAYIDFILFQGYMKMWNKMVISVNRHEATAPFTWCNADLRFKWTLSTIF